MRISLKQKYYKTKNGSVVSLSVNFKRSSGKYFSLDYNYPYVGTLISEEAGFERYRCNEKGEAPYNPPWNIVAKATYKEFYERQKLANRSN